MNFFVFFFDFWVDWFSHLRKTIFALSHSRRENIVKMIAIIHDRECLSLCEKSCVFHARHACLRIINREIDHFNRFKVEIEFFVRFFLKFIENDRLSWMKNTVNCNWWMRKWIVNKMKIKRKIILRFKKLFFSFVVVQAFFIIHSFTFFLINLQNFLKIFVISSVWKLSSFLNIIKFDRSFFNNLNIVLDKKKNSKCC
jgi:hypothetical protein